MQEYADNSDEDGAVPSPRTTQRIEGEKERSNQAMTKHIQEDSSPSNSSEEEGA